MWWIPLVLAVAGFVGGAFTLWWGGGWQIRDRKSILDLQSIAAAMDPGDPERERLEYHIGARVTEYLNFARVPNRERSRRYLTWGAGFSAAILVTGLTALYLRPVAGAAASALVGVVTSIAVRIATDRTESDRRPDLGP